jgi:hypothetical protein
VSACFSASLRCKLRLKRSPIARDRASSGELCHRLCRALPFVAATPPRIACTHLQPSDLGWTFLIVYTFACCNRCTMHLWTTSTARSTVAPAVHQPIDDADRPRPRVKLTTYRSTRADRGGFVK